MASAFLCLRVHCPRAHQRFVPNRGVREPCPGGGCWIGQRKFLRAIALALAAPAGFVICWMALGQSPSHLAVWIRHGLELESGYSGAMSLSPKTPVLGAAVAGLALFAGILIRDHQESAGPPSLLGGSDHPCSIYFPGVEGGIHAFRGLARLCLPLVSAAGHGVLLPQRPAWRPPRISPAGIGCRLRRRMALCLVAAHFQIPGFAWRQATDWPRRVTHACGVDLCHLAGTRGRPLCRLPRFQQCPDVTVSTTPKDVIGNESVDVMNYLLLAAVVNEMNYQPRPVIQGFVAYTPALQSSQRANTSKAPGGPILCCCPSKATDGRIPRPGRFRRAELRPQ